MRTKLILALPVAGCAMGGAMHQASLAGQCAKDDVACSRRHPLAPLAVGARFYPDVSTEISGSSTPNLRLESAAPDVIGVAGGSLVAKKPGASAVLISTEDGAVVDFVHVWAAPVTSIGIARRDGDRVAGTIGLAVGEDITLVPTLWNGAQRLGGDADPQWTIVAQGEPLVILRDGSSDRRRLRARAAGKATVTVAVGEAKASVDVEVVP
jgi:hypothetical protein